MEEKKTEELMQIVKEDAEDSVKISEEVVAVITGIATSETEGVISVGTNSIAANWTELISGKKNNSRGIKIDMKDGKVALDIQIVVRYGMSIPKVAADVQSAVKTAIEEMTGLEVTNVDIRVIGIRTAQEEKKPAKKPEDETEPTEA